MYVVATSFPLRGVTMDALQAMVVAGQSCPRNVVPHSVASTPPFGVHPDEML